jgi:hypothetical protein
VEFEWDADKAALNVRKHNVAFSKAATVFGDALSVTVGDPDHSAAQRRFITIGCSQRGRPLMVAHTQRGERVRIISARTLTRGERKAYEAFER